VTDFRGSDGQPLAYHSSVGIAECPPYEDLTALLIHADRAMYAAKQARGGAWRIYGDDAGAEQLDTGAAAASEAPGTHQHS
jgi:predicted signal transduction protein with EAL and GGDEF domain